MTKQEMATDIYVAATKYAKAKGFRFGDGADSDIKALARAAADKILEVPKDRADRLARTHRAFETLVDGMIAQSKRIKGYALVNPGIIGEKTLAAALAAKGFCPLWPIC